MPLLLVNWNNQIFCLWNYFKVSMLKIYNRESICLRRKKSAVQNLTIHVNKTTSGANRRFTRFLFLQSVTLQTRVIRVTNSSPELRYGATLIYLSCFVVLSLAIFSCFYLSVFLLSFWLSISFLEINQFITRTYRFKAIFSRLTFDGDKPKFYI